MSHKPSLIRPPVILGILLVLFVIAGFFGSNYQTLFDSNVNRNFTRGERNVIDSLIRCYTNIEKETYPATMVIDTGVMRYATKPEKMYAIWYQIREVATHTIDDIDSAATLDSLAIANNDPEMKSYADIALGSKFATEGDYTTALELEQQGLHIAEDGIQLAEGWLNPAFYAYDICYAYRVRGYTYRLMHRDSDALDNFKRAEDAQIFLESTAHEYWARLTRKTEKDTIQKALLHTNMAYSFLACHNIAQACLYADSVAADSTNMIRARYWHLRALLEQSKECKCDTDIIEAYYQRCFGYCRRDSARRITLTNVAARLDLARYLSNDTLAKKQLDTSLNLSRYRYPQQAVDAADLLSRKISIKDSGLRYADTLIVLTRYRDSLSLVHTQTHLAMIEKVIHEEKDEENSKNFILGGLFLSSLILGAGLFFWSRKKNKRPEWFTLAFIFIAEFWGLMIHEFMDRLTHSDIWFILGALVLTGGIFHFLDEYLKRRKGSQPEI